MATIEIHGTLTLDQTSGQQTGTDGDDLAEAPQYRLEPRQLEPEHFEVEIRDAATAAFAAHQGIANGAADQDGGSASARQGFCDFEDARSIGGVA